MVASSLYGMASKCGILNFENLDARQVVVGHNFEQSLNLFWERFLAGRKAKDSQKEDEDTAMAQRRDETHHDDGKPRIPRVSK